VDRLRERADVLIGFDPGLNQLLIATGVMAGVAVTIGLVYVFVQVTHAMWIEPPGAARLAPAALAALHLQHHAATLLAMLLGGLIAMLAAFTVAETDPRQLGLTMAVGPIPMLAALALATALKGERTVGIAVMAGVMGIGSWLPRLAPRIGARAFFLGQLLFVGYLVGFLSAGAVRSSQLGWIAAILWFAAACNLALKLLVFAPLAGGALRRTRRAFFARARRAIVAAADLYETRPGSSPYRRARRRLDRRLTRLNEAALLIDGLLAEHTEIAHETHARLFDTELTVQNIGRLSEALFDAGPPVALRQAIADCLAVSAQTAGSSGRPASPRWWRGAGREPWRGSAP
jgi:hypothetical protein